MKIQFYTSDTLEEKLNNEAKQLGVSVSTLVNDLLNNHYGLIPASFLSSSEIRKLVFEEIAGFVNQKKLIKDYEEFDLNKASKLYKHIEMVHIGKPSILKAQIGKEFNTKYVGRIEPFMNIEQLKLANGKPKLSISNRAALYKIFEKKDNEKEKQKL